MLGTSATRNDDTALLERNRPTEQSNLVTTSVLFGTPELVVWYTIRFGSDDSLKHRSCQFDVLLVSGWVRRNDSVKGRRKPVS